MPLQLQSTLHPHPHPHPHTLSASCPEAWLGLWQVHEAHSQSFTPGWCSYVTFYRWRREAVLRTRTTLNISGPFLRSVFINITNFPHGWALEIFIGKWKRMRPTGARVWYWLLKPPGSSSVDLPRLVPWGPFLLITVQNHHNVNYDTFTDFITEFSTVLTMSYALPWNIRDDVTKLISGNLRYWSPLSTSNSWGGPWTSDRPMCKMAINSSLWVATADKGSKASNPTLGPGH